MAHEHIEDWAAPVYGAIAQPRLYAGVAPAFFLLDLFGTLVACFVCVLACPQYVLLPVLIGPGLYGGIAAATQWEPAFVGIVLDYLTAAAYYEA